MRSDWFAEALDDACVVEYGTRVVRKKHGGSVYPVYGGGGETFRMDTFNRENRVVVSRFGVSDECVRYVSGKFFLNDSGLTVAARDAGKFSQRFLDYQLFSLNDSIYKLCRGTAQKNLDVDSFRELKIAAPKKLPEQQHIVAILDETFAGLATATANAEKNLKNARELFESHLNSVFMEKGEGWSNRQLSEIIDVAHGLAFDGKYFVENENAHPILLTPGNFTELGSLSFNERNTKRFTGDVPPSFVLNEGDLVVVMTDLSSKMKILGKPAFVDRSGILHNSGSGG